jgi:hypothetical protein
MAKSLTKKRKYPNPMSTAERSACKKFSGKVQRAWVLAGCPHEGVVVDCDLHVPLPFTELKTAVKAEK